MNDQTALTKLAAEQLLGLYASGALSPVEVTRAVLARIAALDSSLNAFCLVDEAAAFQSAQRSEQRWLNHQRNHTPVGALEGVPVSIKDLVLTKGWPTLRGSAAIDTHQVWEVDAPVTQRLREAGAVLLGKTNTPEFGCKAVTNSPRTGITRNPWNLNRTAGGSSGGAAAAVAAGMGPCAIGTDGAGSVRIPAAFCGNVGFKPSFGRVPAYPLSPFGSVAHLGPHTMSVVDAALMMNVMALPDARDWTSLPYEPINYLSKLHDGVKGLRIAYSPTLGHAQVDVEVAAAVRKAVELLSDIGAHVEECDLGFSDPLDIITGLWFAGAWQIWSTLSEQQQVLTDPDFRAQAELGSRLSTNDIHQLNQRRGLLGSHMRQFMQSYDLIATPTVAVPAFDAKPAGHEVMNAETMLGWTPFTYPFNLTQQPAITVPCGLTKDGLPIALQLVGPMFGDELVLRAARAFEERYPVLRPTI